MRLKVTDIVILILVGVLGWVAYTRIVGPGTEHIDDTQIQESGSIESDLEEVLGIDIADEGEKLELSEGDSKAVVTKTEDQLSIIADLPEPEAGETYTATNLGELTQAKGGYILDSSDTSVSNIEIKKGDETILQGSF